MFCGFSFVKLSRKHHCNAPKLHYLCIKSEDKLHPGIKNEQVHFILLSVCIIFASNCSDYDYKGIFSFRQNKYFWINILAMIAVVVLLMFGTLKGIDIYTHHGEAVVVPDVKGMTVAEAGAVFDSRGLACIVSDSTYVKDKPAGCILDYNPAAGQKVKEGRIII